VIEDIVKFICLMQGALVVGLAVVTIIFYNGELRMRHILYMSASYTMLTLLVIVESWKLVEFGTFASYVIKLTCFGLGDYGLLMIMATVRERIINSSKAGT